MLRAQLESDRFHHEYYSSHALFEAGTWLEKPNSSVMELGSFLAGRDGVRALDLGAGVGRNSIPFVKLFGSGAVLCDCVEILPMAVEKLRENAKVFDVADRIAPICSTVSEYQIAPEVYDLVTAMSVLEHAYDRDTISNGIRTIQAGTKITGFNCLSFATDLTETDLDTGRALEPLISTRLSKEECRSLFSALYADWEIQKLDFSSFGEQLNRDGRTISWRANYCIFVARRTG